MKTRRKKSTRLRARPNWDPSDDDLIDEDPPDAFTTPGSEVEQRAAVQSESSSALTKCPDCQDGWYTGLIERRLCETCGGQGFLPDR